MTSIAHTRMIPSKRLSLLNMPVAPTINTVFVCCVYLALSGKIHTALSIIFVWLNIFCFVSFLAHVAQFGQCFDLFGIDLNDSTEDYDIHASFSPLQSAPSDDTHWQVHPLANKNKDSNEGIYDLINDQIASEDPIAKCSSDGFVLNNLFGFITEPLFETWQKGPINCKWIIQSSFKSDVVVIR